MAEIQKQNFGVEIETTGRTRRTVAEAVHGVVGGTVIHVGQPAVFNPWHVEAADGRIWKIVADSSLGSVEKGLQAEIVSPVLIYSDIPTLQEVVRAVRRTGAKADAGCAVHVHVDASNHSARSLTNLLKILHAHERHLVEALGVRAERRRTYAKDVDEELIRRVCGRPPRTMAQLSEAWYGGRRPRPGKYDRTRYRGLNLHTVFTLGTVEFRLFDGTLHAGKIRSYIVLALALSAYAMNVRHARAERRAYDGAVTKYDVRTLLLRLGLIGEEFRNVRMHLLARLSGSSAWRRAS